MRYEDYPALFKCADEASNQKQAFYLNLIRTEYGLLLLAAVFSLDFVQGTFFYIVYGLVFVASLATLLVRTFKKPEQEWYRCRALAESTKTLTWRYMMQAEPFSGNSLRAKTEFRNHLQNLFQENRDTAQIILPNWSADDQTNIEMDRVRSGTLPERVAYYRQHRIEDQRVWYANKAGWNRRASGKWVLVATLAYALATILVLSRIGLTEWHIWPIEPIIVFAASIVGWMQIKKFNELGAAYTVTAHEIGLIKSGLDHIQTEEEFSQFIISAEQAFSREHTLWIARQTN